MRNQISKCKYYQFQEKYVDRLGKVDMTNIFYIEFVLYFNHCFCQTRLIGSFYQFCYSPNSVYIRMTTIGRSKRIYLSQKLDASQFPGVGSYHLQSSLLKEVGVNRFTRAARPASQSTLSREKRFSSLSGLKPGPGSYSLMLSRKNRPASFSKSKRFITDLPTKPGPGSYRSQSSSSQKPKFGIMLKSERNTLNSLNDNPGPTNYDGAVAIKYKKKPPTIIMGKAKKYFQNVQKSPGPGDYNLSKRKSPFQLKNQSLKETQGGLNLKRIWQGMKIGRKAKIVNYNI